MNPIIKTSQQLPILNPENTLLLVIDVQEKLIKSVLNRNQVIWNIKRLTKASSILRFNIIYSEQNPSKLGKTIEEIKENRYLDVYSKMTFSCCRSNKIKKKLRESCKRNILICGIETHVCVQQTCLDLLSIGFQPHLLIDAISSRKLIDHETSIRKLESCGILLTTTEAVIFEICETAERTEFKQISSIIKENAPLID